jgi:methylglutaconyl-CoA hydratase
MSYETLKLEFGGHLATLTLNRPEKRNALSLRMLEELEAALAEAESCRAVILTGAGKAFCSGMDLDVLQVTATQSAEQNLREWRRVASIFLKVYRYPRPLISAVNGAAIAGGCGLATLCDFTLAVPEAKFGYSEVRVGFIPALVSTFLVRQIGEKRAADMLLSGRLVDAQEAYRLGMVSEVVPAEKLQERARELAAVLAASSPTSLLRTKRLLRSFSEEEITREFELAVQESVNIRSTADFREGLAAFLEKRPPRWSG